MSALHFFGLGILILTLLPAIVLTIERRNTPPACHVALAAAGVLYSGLAAGASGVLLALLSGMGLALFLATIVASTQNRFGYRMMSGSEILLFGAAATWLPPMLAVGAVLICLVAVASTLFAGHLGKTAPHRPHLAFYITGSCFLTFCFHLGS